jgi:4-amino-4-deoxy-L-arabinose transferase-like glycosyltransferase
MYPQPTFERTEDIPVARSISLQETGAMVFLAALVAAIVSWRWVGYQGGDDHYYAEAALAWLNDFPALGTSHWSLRYPLVLPIALSVLVFGKSTFAIGLVSLAYYLGILAVDYYFVRRWFGWKTAFIAGLIAALLPAMPVQATYADCDMAEIFFVMSSFWFFLLGCRGRHKTTSLLASGALAGMAFLTRETTVALLLFYAVLFLFRPGMARVRYVIMALGFIAVVGAEMTYFAAMTGNPLYRQAISAHHDQVDRERQIEATQKSGNIIDGEGVLSVNKYLDPLLILLVSQKFGLLFYLAIPAAISACFGRWLGGWQRAVAGYAGLLALVWFLFFSLGTGILYLVPRYFMMAALAASIPLAVATSHMLRRRPLPTVLLGAAFLASSLGLLYLENTHPLYAEELLADYVGKSSQTVYTDPKTYGRATFLLDIRGLGDRVAYSPPPPGAVVAIRPGMVEACRLSLHCPKPEAMAPFEVKPDWTLLEHQDGSIRALGKLLRLMGADRLIPTQIMQKIDGSTIGIAIYRTPGR